MFVTQNQLPAYFAQLPLEEVTSSNFIDEAGKVIQKTLLVKDANNRLFSLHVQSQESIVHYDDHGEDLSEGEIEVAEPTFVLPGNSIADSDINLLLEEAGPRLLALYLVEQEA
jgi:hypothetical protein